MNTVLAIDTASTEFALALAVDGTIVSSLARDGAQDHSRLLLSAIDELLGERRARLTGVLVTRGPGSYAGLRVGIATAQGLAFARGVPLRGVATLEAVAAAAGLSDFTAIHPAGRGEFAAQDFRAGAPAGALRSATATELTGLKLAGEGAGALGGMEIGPEARCRAALSRALASFSEQEGGEVEALYLREPSISLPRTARAGGAR